MDSKEQFYRHFQAEVLDIQDHIGRLGLVAAVGGQRKDATDSILASISKLSLEVADAADFIPAYDQRTYASSVKSLTDELNAELARLAPAKARFQFKRTAKKPAAAATGGSAPAPDPRLLRGTNKTTGASASSQTGSAPIPAAAAADAVLPSKDYNAEMEAQTGTPAADNNGLRRPSFSKAREVVLADHTGLRIVLPLSAAGATTAYGSLSALRACVVDMSVPTASRARGGGGAAFQSLMLRDLARCLIVAGRVRGAVHITGLRDCVLVVAARQVRIHESRNVDVYLQTTHGGRPIIEDCRGMRFAPLPKAWGEDDGKGEAETDTTDDSWAQVDDFKWLRADQPSPNWCVLPEADRLPETVWTDVVAGELGLGTEDVLRAVGLGKEAVAARP